MFTKTFYNMLSFEEDLKQSLTTLQNGGIILYPTDTVWGLGCDATDATAVKKIYELKKRSDTKSLIVLLATERDILKYVAAPDPRIFDFLEGQQKPTTVIFSGPIGFADNLIGPDHSIAIRIAKDEFCRHLIKRFRKPIVSTSANFSGSPTPKNFAGIEAGIKQGADYVVTYRQDDLAESKPSKIVSWRGGQLVVIRE